MNRTIPAAVALLLACGLTGCASDDTASVPTTPSASVSDAEPSESSTAPDADQSVAAEEGGAVVATQGAWIDYAAYEADPATFHESGDVVLFFNASWCPTCQATVKSLDADGVPAGLTVVSVDYDAATDLRQQYGVTVQHTFVQVDGAGTQVARFTGSVSGEDIADQIA